MDDTIYQTMIDRQSFLILNDDCIIQIFQRLELVEFVNLANTCSRIRDLAYNFHSRNYRQIKIHTLSFKASDNFLSKNEFLNVLCVIGKNVVEVDIYLGNPFNIQLIQEKCRNLKSIAMFGNKAPQVLQGIRNLKQLKINEYESIGIKEWKDFFASNPELEVLDFIGFYQNGFMKLLSRLPKLQSLGLPHFNTFLHDTAEFRHLLKFIDLRKLSLRSNVNINKVLVYLVKNLNLVELEIQMVFDEESIGIIKSFKNLEVLSIHCNGHWNNAWFSNATVYSSKLKRLKINNIKISCSQLLEMVQHLTFLEEFDIGETGNIYLDYNYDSHIRKELIINSIEDALQRNLRKLKILSWHKYEYSHYMHRSDHLQIINNWFVEQDQKSQSLFVYST